MDVVDIKVEMKSMNEILENVKEEETFDEPFKPKILVGECEVGLLKCFIKFDYF